VKTRRSRAAAVAGVAISTLLWSTAPAAAQGFRPGELAAAVQFQGYDFANELGVEAANLVLLPVAYTFGVGRGINFDVYTAVARGAALIGGTEFTLSGATDTRIRANVPATRWAVLTFGLNVPTGTTGFTGNEARVAAVLSTDLLGFREANFGLGFGATTGVATAHRFGDTGVGAGVSYRFAGGFNPSADTAFTYTPGNELRVRVGMDRNIGRGRFTAGVTFQNFETDQVDGADLFQPGGRLRGDLSYSFRSSPSATWTLFATDIWRDHGDVRFSRLDTETGLPRDEPVRTGTQNLLVGGVAGAWRMSPTLTLQPMLEGRILSRQDPGGDGWLLGFGSGLPLRAGGVSVTPTARLSFGGIEDEAGRSYRIIGGELSIAASFGRR
jgi:hypothetical protein